MKETKKSLKVYFIVIGVIGLAGSIFSLLASNNNVVNIILSVLNIILAGLFIAFGLKIDDFIKKSPKLLTNFVITFTALNAILYLLAGLYLLFIVVVLIGWYLIRNIKNLAKVEASSNTQAA